MITLRRLDLVRQEAPATADELASLQTQLNALPFIQMQVRVGDPPPLESEPSGYLELEFRGEHYVLPFFAKA